MSAGELGRAPRAGRGRGAGLREAVHRRARLAGLAPLFELVDRPKTVRRNAMGVGRRGGRTLGSGTKARPPRSAGEGRLFSDRCAGTVASSIGASAARGRLLSRSWACTVGQARMPADEQAGPDRATGMPSRRRRRFGSRAC